MIPFFSKLRVLIFDCMSFKNLALAFLAVIPLFMMLSCNRQKPLTIIVTKLSPNYLNWLKSADTTINVVDVYGMPVDSALALLKKSHGLLVTGGEDVYPGYYGKEADTNRCDKPDLSRDTLEMKLLEQAFADKMPVFGICRGQQIINVLLGGSLIIDIPTDFDSSLSHRCNDYLNCLHRISVVDGSNLKHITGVSEGLVNSNHHQGIDQIAADLRPTAYADDHLIEAIEWKEPKDKSFLVAVQWHPERLTQNKGMSEPLVKQFVAEAEKYRKK